MNFLTIEPMHAAPTVRIDDAAPPALHAAAGSDAAADGKTYWNCWTSNYRRDVDGYIEHAFCLEERTGKTLCGVPFTEGGMVSIPREMDQPTCLKCERIMRRRGAIPSRQNVIAEASGTAPSSSDH